MPPIFSCHWYKINSIDFGVITHMRYAVFPCLGLGDGLISLILSQHLSQRGDEVLTYHPLLPQMGRFFPGLFFGGRPKDFKVLEKAEKIIFFYEKLDWMQRQMEYALAYFPEKTTILNPIATPHRDYPYWEEGEFDGRKPFVDNLAKFCKEKLGDLSSKDTSSKGTPSKYNGLVLPDGVVLRQHKKRVVIHPTSSREGKNWSKGKYISLGNCLAKSGWNPVFILTAKEKLLFPEIEAPRFPDLSHVAHFVAESGYMIGNDSGIGHLASCLGVPTLTICRSRMAGDFWRPAWQKGLVITPPGWIPNIKGLRLRDKHWQKFVSVSHVEKKFLDLCELGIFAH